MTQQAENRCPVCGGTMDAAGEERVRALHTQIHDLQAQLRQLEEELHPDTHPTGLWGGYGGDPTLGESKT